MNLKRRFSQVKFWSLFRYLLVTASAVTFILIVLGVVVRSSGSASACPDWPTCTGTWVLPSSEAALYPFLHRFVALMSGFLLGVSTLLAWRWGGSRKITVILTAATSIFIIQALLGAFLVIPFSFSNIALPIIFTQNGFSTLLSGLHLSLALIILALMLVTTVFVTNFDQVGITTIRLVFTTPYARLSLATAVMVFILLVSGIVVSASGISTTCTGWPLCNGFYLPVDLLGWANLVHRAITGLAIVMMAVLLVRSWKTKRDQTAILVATTTAATLLFMQVFMGIFELIRDFPEYLLGLHVATAVAVWASLVIQLVLSGLTDQTNQYEQSQVERRVFNRGMFKDFLMLTKPIVVALLLVTTYAGMVLGAKALPPLEVFFWTIVAGAMAAGGSSAVNQYIDRFDDGKMQRTSRRPIPSGRLTAGEGLAFGVALCIISFYIMVSFVNFLAAVLTLVGMIYYIVFYSLLLKKLTVQNIVIGGGAGAIPPLVGWAAASGSLNIPSLFLFAVVFLWTPPHFWALALVRRKDYARAGIPMLPVVRGEAETRWQIFLYTLYLVALTLFLPVFGLGGGIYLVSAVVLGGGLIFSSWKVLKESGNKVAWRMYRHSSMYLAFLFVALVVDVLI